MNKINELKLFSGINRADCTTCSRRSLILPERDGIHCDIFKQVTGDNCVKGGDINIEKSCWTPNFWISEQLKQISLKEWFSYTTTQVNTLVEEFNKQVSKILISFHVPKCDIKMTSEIKSLFKDPKMSDRRIAEELNISLASARTKRSRLGCGRLKIFELAYKEVGEKFREGNTIEQLADEYDISKLQIGKALFAEGLISKNQRHGSGDKSKVYQMFRFPDEHWFPYNLYLNKEINESSKFYGVPFKIYKKWIKETPEGRKYFAYVQGLEYDEEERTRFLPLFEKVSEVLKKYEKEQQQK